MRSRRGAWVVGVAMYHMSRHVVGGVLPSPRPILSFVCTALVADRVKCNTTNLPLVAKLEYCVPYSDTLDDNYGEFATHALFLNRHARAVWRGFRWLADGRTVLKLAGLSRSAGACAIGGFAPWSAPGRQSNGRRLDRLANRLGAWLHGQLVACRIGWLVGWLVAWSGGCAGGRCIRPDCLGDRAR